MNTDELSAPADALAPDPPAPQDSADPRDLHELLTRVADGSLDPTRASRLLATGTVPRVTAPTGATDEAPVRAITVTATGVRLTLVADPSVATAVAEGPHRVRQDGDTLHVELPGADTPEQARRWQFGNVRIGWPAGGGERVRLRVNPALDLRLELVACEAKVRGTRAALEVGCFSGSVTVADHAGPLSGTITTGSARIEAVLRGEADQLSCDMGSLQLMLLPGSDTTVVGYADMGSFKVAGAAVEAGPDDATGLRTAHRVQVGAGTGQLTVGVRMGSAKVTVP